ncbi:solute carrier family 13 member 2 [Folsomia candida]|uniref:solute carrier family 13 member 2 n=1 Tax=Folsomia candida TaxID=158441 RepID=UPI0016050C70|nr:solute carrier family 13 member 2 [Folsomia candida]
MLDTILKRKSWELSPGETKPITPKMYFGFFLKNGWTLLLSVGVPILLIVVPLCLEGHTGKEPYAAYVIILMAIYWCTECIPLPVTAFLPVILYPAFGISDTDKVTSAYFSDSIMFLFGGCVLALSFEYTNLHSRIALHVIMFVGAKLPQLMLGIMGTTAFLSMWMNNTSTTAMMVPIVDAIITELKKKMLEVHTEDAPTPTSDAVLPATEQQPHTVKAEDPSKKPDKDEKLRKINKRIHNIKTMFLLATAYSSNIGGTGVITGSGTNVIVLDLVRKDADEELASLECKKMLEISFLDWMLFNIPPMLINIILCWIYLQIHFLGIPQFLKFWEKKTEEQMEIEAMNSKFEKSVETTMKRQYQELGPIRFNELGVLVLFSIMVVLWVFKDPQFIPGWDALPFFDRTPSGKSLIKECTSTLLICFIMFVTPGRAIYYKTIGSGGLGEGVKDPLLSFDFIMRKFPWGIFILLGGGSAMALGAKESGLNKWVEEFLETNETLKTLPGPVILGIVLIFIATLTSVASNTATAAIVTPVLLGLSYVKNMHPLYMVYAASTACSYAFVLPVSTPPNAIVYSSSDLKLAEMMKPGFLINIICLVILFVTTHTTSWWIFGFGDYNGECSSMATLSEAPAGHH